MMTATARHIREQSIKPPRLYAGDAIGIISPAGVLDDARRSRLDLALAHLRRLGYAVFEGAFARERRGYFAGADEKRAQDLNDMLRNPDIKALFCSRGGYGSARILDKIDYAAARECPKIIVGYSDVTALSLALWAKLGLVTFSGPMAAIELFDMHRRTADSLWRLLAGATPTWRAGVHGNAWEKISLGVAEGILLGGCLSVVASLIGTPYCPDFSGAILLLEDIGEHLYRIDRLFSQLKNAGILDAVHGIVLGHFVDIIPDSSDNPVDFIDIISYYCAPLEIPVICNFPYGHIPIKYTLPMGCRVRLNADAGVLKLLEPGVK
ncbi:LD-carboxypeptidase [candidate division KSB1 bacterium]|nr:LD-carboxypeptidase [candidate division KSB1 bacterium]RQW10787.1 MAG: LD-carboxypeptidase [candidate division KSB1 bacterium]